MPRPAQLNEASRKTRVVAGILLAADGTALIADRRRADTMCDYWEFPGGKVASGESPQWAIRRELREELGIRVRSAEHLCYLEHRYPGLAVALDFFLVRSWDGEPAGLEGQRIRWVPIAELDRQNLLPADFPVIEALRQLTAR